MTADEQPPRHQDYLKGPSRSLPPPERVPDPYYRSSVFIMLDDEPASAERLAQHGWEWEGPQPRRRWQASDQGEFEILAEFEGTRDEALAWALERPNVRRIYLYSEATRDIAQVDRDAVPWGADRFRDGPRPPLVPESFFDGTILLRSFVDDDWRLEQQLSRDEAVVAGTTYPADLDEAGALDRVRRAARWLLDGRGGRWVIERDGVPQGTAGLVLHDETSVEIFYALLAAHRGRGTATWTARVLAEWASSAGCSRVTLATLVDNAASQRTAERAGFVRSGQVQRLHKGTSADFVEWSYVPASV
jgi:RimJ/RimL family protein N-acetyltransferase